MIMLTFPLVLRWGRIMATATRINSVGEVSVALGVHLSVVAVPHA